MLSGILYMHQISDSRMVASPPENLKIIEQLCGKNAPRKIVLITTMWDLVENEDGVSLEQELVNKFWSPMIKQGSRTVRFTRTKESGWNIIEKLLFKDSKADGTLSRSSLSNTASPHWSSTGARPFIARAR